jgi:hypothetical protein
MKNKALKDVSNDRLLALISEQNTYIEAYKKRSVELKAANDTFWYNENAKEITRVTDYLLILEQERKARML